MKRAKKAARAPFWPFLCTPTAHEQMSVMMCDEIGAQQKPGFLQKVFAGAARAAPGDIRVRIFDFDGSVVFAVILVTAATEPTSGRDGLMLAVGFGVRDFAYLETGEAIELLMRLLIDDLNAQLGLDLLGSGAKTLIESNLAPGASPKLEQTVSLFSSVGQMAATVLPQASSPLTRLLRRLKWGRGQVAKRRPNYLLLLDGEIEGPFRDAFKALTHEVIVRLRSSDQTASIGGESGLSEEITIRRLGLAREAGKIAKCVLVKDTAVPYLALYA